MEENTSMNRNRNKGIEHTLRVECVYESNQEFD